MNNVTFVNDQLFRLDVHAQHHLDEEDVQNVADQQNSEHLRSPQNLQAASELFDHK